MNTDEIVIFMFRFCLLIFLLVSRWIFAFKYDWQKSMNLFFKKVRLNLPSMNNKNLDWFAVGFHYL